jgi:hypothetical protein
VSSRGVATHRLPDSLCETIVPLLLRQAVHDTVRASLDVVGPSFGVI